MISLFRADLHILLKIYVAAVLIAAAVLSPLALSFVPVLLLAWFLIQWRWPFTPLVNLMTQYFMFFAVNLLFSQTIGSFLPLLTALPLLVPFDQSIREMPKVLIADSHLVRRLTGTSVMLGSVTLAVFLASLAVGNLTLILACSIITIYFAVLVAVTFKYLPPRPVEEIPVQLRVISGKEEHREINFTVKTRIGSVLYLKSPYEWLKVSPASESLEVDKLTFKVTMEATLSGPSEIKLNGFAFDRWGLFQVRFEVTPIKMMVIPKARYAEWLARKYMSGTKQGTLPMVSNIGAMKPLFGLRRGIEYYGNQVYHPGDSLKNIDWKHSYKYNELISREFSEFQGQSAIVLINLVAGNEEEKDNLAYNILITAISLAQENIPSAMAVYNDKNVVLTTDSLIPQRLVAQALQIVKDIIVIVRPMRYLEPPDVMRLKTNIRRVQQVDSPPAHALGELLQLEYKYLGHNAESNPATKAISEVQAKLTQQATMVVISHRNHDAEALAVNELMASRKGTAVIYL
jgi:hypothetical protein